MVTENKRRSTTKKPKKVNNLRYAEYYDMQDGAWSFIGQIFTLPHWLPCGIGGLAPCFF